MGGGIVRRRIPVCCADETRADQSSVGRWLSACENGPALRVNGFRPIQLFYERNGREEFPVGAIENVEETVAVGLDQQLSGLALVGNVEKNGSFRGVKVEKVVRSELEIPFELAGIGVEGENAIGIKIVAGAGRSVKIGRGIAGAPKDGVEGGIVSAGHPGGAAAAQV